MGARQNKTIECTECGHPHYDTDTLIINCIKCGGVVKDDREKCKHPMKACMYGVCGYCGQKVP